MGDPWLIKLGVLAMIAAAVAFPVGAHLRRRRRAASLGEDPGRRETRRVVLRLLANGDEPGLAERRPILLAAVGEALESGMPRLDAAAVPSCADLIWRLVAAYRRSGGAELSHRDVAVLYILATAPHAAAELEDLVRVNPRVRTGGGGDAMFRQCLAA